MNQCELFRMSSVASLVNNPAINEWQAELILLILIFRTASLACYLVLPWRRVASSSRNVTFGRGPGGQFPTFREDRLSRISEWKDWSPAHVI
jgi:hypothetical protein